MLMEEYRHYQSPGNKLSRLAAAGEIIPVVRGIYETDGNVSGYLLAGSIYGPSYLSFSFALSRYGLIPEAVYTYTSATFEKKKKKRYTTFFGTFTYRDVPSAVYPIDILLQREGGYSYQIATAEKALCDLLYTQPPAGSQKELIAMLFDDLRIDPDRFAELDRERIMELAGRYHCRNLKLLSQIIRRRL